MIFDCQCGLAGGLNLTGMSGETRPGSILEEPMALYLLGIENGRQNWSDVGQCPMKCSLVVDHSLVSGPRVERGAY